MAEYRVKVTCGRAKLMAFLRDLPGICAGHIPDTHGIMSPPLYAAVLKTMELQKADYLKKSVGQAGDDGVIWEDNSFYTLDKRLEKKGVKGGAKQRAKRRQLGKQDYATEPIMIEDKRLLESASPGQLVGYASGTSYVPPGQTGDQVVTVEPGKVTVTCGVPYAYRHMGGELSSDLRVPVPTRPPYTEDVPSPWVEKMAEGYADKLAECIAEAVVKL